MSVRSDLRNAEYTMTRRIGVGGIAEACLRPDAVRGIATRLLTWRDAPENCQNCHALPAVRLHAGLPMCSRCRENRLIASGHFLSDVVGLKPSTVRTDVTTSDQQLRGHMIVFNQPSLDMGFVEYVRPRAADRLMAEKPDLRALWNHNTDEPLGRTSAGTFRYQKVTRGVAVEIDPPNAAYGRVESVARRDVTGMSFGFFALEDDWWLENGYPHRELLDMEVIEGSATPFPAYPATDIRVVNAGARSAWQIERETQERLRMAR